MRNKLCVFFRKGLRKIIGKTRRISGFRVLGSADG